MHIYVYLTYTHIYIYQFLYIIYEICIISKGSSLGQTLIKIKK